MHEIKFDGYRLMARIDRGRVKLLTRKGLDWTTKFTSVKKALEGLPVVTAMLDGEVVVESESGAPSFTELQADLSAGRSDRFRYYLFDLLHLDGTDLSGAPLIERKAALARLLAGHNGTLTYSEHFEGGGATVLEHACRLGLEGVVSKLKTAHLPLRARQVLDQGQVRRGVRARHRRLRALHHPAPRHRLAGGGCRGTARETSAMPAALAQDTPAPSPRTCGAAWRACACRRRRWRSRRPPTCAATCAGCRPALVAEVELRGWTADGIVRHAVFKGLRPDKEAADVVQPEARQPRAKAAPSLPVTLTHPDRVLWPAVGVTKQGLAEFYAEIWPWIAPHIVNRPLALVRCPGGVDETCFFQKHAFAGMSDQVARSRDPEDGEEILTISNLEGLLSLVQASVLEIHVWGATLDDIEKPDGITFDLDPAPDVDWPDVVEPRPSRCATA